MNKRLVKILSASVLAVLLLIGCGLSEVEDNPDIVEQSLVQIEESATQEETLIELTSEAIEEAHAHNYVEAITTEATCTENGEKTFSCECGDIYTEEISAIGHSYDEGVITTEATCEDKGVKTFTCECGDTFTEEILSTGHNYEVIAGSEVEASCTQEGKEADTKCSACGDVISGVAIAATGHSYGSYKYNDDATTSKDGTETATCSNCGSNDTRIKEGTKINVTYVWIPQSGSKYHRKSSCSNMKNPSKVTIDEAKRRGYEACKKCY